MSNQKPSCIQCGRDDSLVPLVVINYQASEYRICTEHFPILIHHPHELTGKIPDADKINPADHDD
jgi:hypothetical protein